MKRLDLVRKLRMAGCYLKPKAGIVEAVLRHDEIKEPLARKILKSLHAD